MTNYQNGRRFEHKVNQALLADGYVTQLAPGSKGAADLWASKPGQLLMISIKRTNGRIPPGERSALLDLAYRGGGVPIVAHQPVPRKPIVYRLLTGIGPSDWVPFHPDEIEART